MGRALILTLALLATGFAGTVRVDAVSSTLQPARQTGDAPQQASPDAPVPEQVTWTVRYGLRRFGESAARVVPALAASMIVLAVFWAAAAVVKRIVRLAARLVRQPTIGHLVTQMSYYAVWLLGIIVALDTLGVDTQTVVTGLGLTGVALGLALRDIISNLVSGVVILATRAFEIGDQIVVGDTEGTVERIDLRATYIRTYDGRLVLVPNGEVSNTRVTNNTASSLRRASVTLFLGYRQDVTLVLSTALDTVRAVDGVASSPPPSVQLHALTPQHMQVEVRFWTDSRRADFMNTASTARIAIVTGLKEKGIELPAPPG